MPSPAFRTLPCLSSSLSLMKQAPGERINDLICTCFCNRVSFHWRGFTSINLENFSSQTTAVLFHTVLPIRGVCFQDTATVLSNEDIPFVQKPILICNLTNFCMNDISQWHCQKIWSLTLRWHGHVEIRSMDFFFRGWTAPSGPRPSYCWGFRNTLTNSLEATDRKHIVVQSPVGRRSGFCCWRVSIQHSSFCLVGGN